MSGVTFCFADQPRKVYWAMLVKVVLPGLLHGRRFEVFGRTGYEKGEADQPFIVPINGGDC